MSASNVEFFSSLILNLFRILRTSSFLMDRRKFVVKSKAKIDLYEWQNQRDNGRTFRLQTGGRAGRKRKTSVNRHVPELVSGLCFIRYSGTCRTHINDGLKPVQRHHSTFHETSGRRAGITKWQTLWDTPCSSIRTVMLLSAMHWYSWDRKTCWSTVRVTGVISSPVTVRLLPLYRGTPSKFALDVVFNPKTTEWKLSYDGQKQGTVTLPVEVPVIIAGTGSGRYRRRTFFQDITHNFNELCDAPSAICVENRSTISRFPDRRFHRRSQIQWRRTRRSGKSTRQDQQAGQQNTRHHGNSLWKTTYGHRLHPESCWQRKNQNSQSRRQYSRQRRDTGTPGTRNFIGQNDRRTVRLSPTAR